MPSTAQKDRPGSSEERGQLGVLWYPSVLATRAQLRHIRAALSPCVKVEYTWGGAASPQPAKGWVRWPGRGGAPAATPSLLEKQRHQGSAAHPL